MVASYAVFWVPRLKSRVDSARTVADCLLKSVSSLFQAAAWYAHHAVATVARPSRAAATNSNMRSAAGFFCGASNRVAYCAAGAGAGSGGAGCLSEDGGA